MFTPGFRPLFTYSRNLMSHLALVLRRRETVAEAMAAVRRDTQKLARTTGIAAHTAGNRKDAVRLTRKGRQAYNSRQYAAAQNLFEQAIDADPSYALALTYLGHTFYKQGQQRLAEAAWKRASNIDPDSEAASKARKKLQHTARATSKTIDGLVDRLKE